MFSSHPEKTDGSAGKKRPSRKDDSASGLLRSAGLVSIGVMASRLLGLVREMVLAYLFRTGAGLDAFYAAFRIPNLARDMFGEGALSKAFVSTFTEVEQKQGREAGLRLANQVVNATLLIVGLVCLAGVVFSESIVDIMFFGEGFDVRLPEGEAFGFATKRELTVFLTRIMFPFLLLVSLAALIMGFLNGRGKFFIPATASLFFNIGSIAVGVLGYFLGPRFGYHPTVGMAIGVVAGGTLQLLWQIPSLINEGFRYRPSLSFRNSQVLKVMRLFGPGALAGASVQANVFINSLFASMGSGWLSWISQAFRLVHLPIGLVGVAVSAATLPALSRSAAVGDWDGFRATFSSSIRMVILFTVPASVGLIVLAEPIVRLIYERGRFQPADTEQVAAALVYYALGLVGYASVKIVTDGFYALQDVRAPLVVSSLSLVGNAGLSGLFIFALGMDHAGLALATSCTMTLSFAFLWVLLRRRSGLEHLDGRSTAIMGAKVIVVSAVVGGVAAATSNGVHRLLGNETFLTRLFQVGLSVGLALVVFYATCKLMRVREMDQALGAIMPARLGRR